MLIVDQNREMRLSIRLFWPYVRLVGILPEARAILAREGIGALQFVNPDTRIRHSVAMELLGMCLNVSGNPSLGLRTAQVMEPGDLGLMEQMGRHCQTLREAIQCNIRYMRLLHEAADVRLQEEGDLATWEFRVTDSVPQLPAANDFVVMCAAMFSRWYTGVFEPAVEVHLMHPRPSYEDEYVNAFRTCVRFEMPCNAFVIRRARLDQPMLKADMNLRSAFEASAAEQSEPHAGCRVSEKARELVSRLLHRGEVSMQAIACMLGTSIPTLRRHLDAEGTSYSIILDDVRRGLAESLLKNPSLSVNHIARSLGFANAGAFRKAFKRWMSTTPSKHRDSAFHDATMSMDG